MKLSDHLKAERDHVKSSLAGEVRRELHNRQKSAEKTSRLIAKTRNFSLAYQWSVRSEESALNDLAVTSDKPFVTAVMLTADRPAMTARAVQSFMAARKTFEAKLRGAA